MSRRFYVIVAAFVVTGAVIVWMVSPRGSKVGTTVAHPFSGAPVMVELAAGDTLAFRLDVAVTRERSDDDEKDRLHDELARSTLTVRAKGPEELVATCPSWAGRVLMSSTLGDQLSLTGVLVECEIPIVRPGNYAVTGLIAKAAGLKIERAELEVRRDRKR